MKKSLLITLCFGLASFVYSQGIYLEPNSVSSGWYTTNLEFRGHTLRMGPKANAWASTEISIVPGGAPSEETSSRLNLYISKSPT